MKIILSSKPLHQNNIKDFNAKNEKITLILINTQPCKKLENTLNVFFSSDIATSFKIWVIFSWLNTVKEYLNVEKINKKDTQIKTPPQKNYLQPYILSYIIIHVIAHASRFCIIVNWTCLPSFFLYPLVISSFSIKLVIANLEIKGKMNRGSQSNNINDLKKIIWYNTCMLNFLF